LICRIATFLCYGSIASEGVDEMANARDPKVTPEDVAKIIEQASKEPGINDMMALLQLSAEITQIEQINRSMMVQPLVAQASSTAGWVR
jgi:hypothetical protein